jgi:FtsH-binding integral membrane protein
MAGCGFIALVTLLGRRIGGEAAGCYAGILAACHPAVLFYAREARGYAFVLMATAGCMYGAIALRHSRRAAGILLTASSLLVTGLHVFGMLVPVGLLAWVLIFSRERSASREIRLVLPVSLACMAIAAGWAVVMHERISHNLDDFWVRTTLVQASSGVLREFLPLPYVSIPALVVGSILLARRKEQRSTFVLLIAVAATVTGGVAVASLFTHGSHHFILPRYLAPLLPVLLLPLALLLSRLPVTYGAICAALLMGAWCYDRPPQRLYRASDPWGADSRATAAHLLKNRRLDERVLVFPEYEGVTLAYYGVSSRKDADRRQPFDALAQPQTDGAGSWLVFYGNQDLEFQRRLLFDGYPLSARFGVIRVFEPFPRSAGPHSPQP